MTGLFDNVENGMWTFKKGDAVWLYWDDRNTGYPQMYHRPAIVTKKIHPASFKVAFAEGDFRKQEPGAWRIDSRSHEHHPSEMHPHNLDPGAELKRRRAVWAQEATQEKQAEWWKSEAERKKLNEDFNRRMRPILARMFG